MLRLILLLLLAVGLAACASDVAETAIRQGDRAMNRLRYAEAVEHYTVAMDAEADIAEAHLGRGRAHWAMGQFEEAVADLDRAIELDPDATWAYYFRGSSLLQIGRFESGIDDLVAATRTEGLPVEDRMRAHYLRAVAYMHLERYDAGIEAITEGIALRPEFAFYYFERGQLYEITGQTDAAIADFEQYLSLAEPGGELAEQAQQRLDALRQSDELAADI